MRGEGGGEEEAEKAGASVFSTQRYPECRPLQRLVAAPSILLNGSGEQLKLYLVVVGVAGNGLRFDGVAVAVICYR